MISNALEHAALCQTKLERRLDIPVRQIVTNLLRGEENTPLEKRLL